MAHAAAMGLLLSACNKKPEPEPVQSGATAGTDTVAAAASAKECCFGKNDCKGKGGCAVPESNSCMGKNECKGKGGCNMHCPK